MELLLDTCVLLWLVADPSRLSQRAADSLAAPTRIGRLSAISAFEIALKHRKGRLVLPLPPRQWLHETLIAYRLTVIPIDEEIAALAATLPTNHGDPCDRLIAATGFVHGVRARDHPQRLAHVALQHRLPGRR